MSDVIIEFLKEVNIGQLCAMAAMLWFFYNRLKTELKGDMKDLRTELKNDIFILSEKVEDVDRRLCRIEGSLATQGHCLFSQNKQEKISDHG